AYYWAPQQSAATMRFLLPTFPAYIIAAVWLLSQIAQQMPKSARVAVPIVVLTAQMLWAVPQVLSETQRHRDSTRTLAIVTNALDENIHHGDVVIANPQILQNLDFVRHWKLADPSALRGG